jgi:long-chain acyl-CoA synthetase
LSRIRDAFAGKTLLLTGVTGFFAKALLAKLLADVPEVRRIYVLIRPGPSAHGPSASVQTRLRREIFDSTAFHPLRQRHREAFATHVAAKVIPIAGDLSQDRFGCDDATPERLAAELDLIVNSAASVSFDERLDEALALNTFGPTRLLQLSKAAGDIPLVQVSTAYVCGDVAGLVPEEPPAVGVTPSARRTGGEAVDLDRLLDDMHRACRDLTREADPEAARRALVAEGLRRARALGWHDVYTMTKSLGEQLLLRERGDVPLCLLRPSIIESALREPHPGWLDGLRMMDPVLVAFARGQLTSYPADPGSPLDLVPVDMVVNGTLAAGACLLRERGLSVYHAATGDVVPSAFGLIAGHIFDYFGRHPLRDKQGRVVRVRPWRYTSSRAFERRLRALRLVPLRVLRQVLATRALTPLRGKWQDTTSTRITAVEQILYLADLYGPYSRLDFTLDTRRFRALAASLDADDRPLFPFDATAIDWREYIQDVHIPGLKHFVLRIEDVPGAGRAKLEMLREAPAVAPSSPAAEVRTLRDVLLRASSRHGGATALEIKQGDRYIQYSFEEAARLAALMGERLLAQGIGASDRVGLLAENRPEWGIGYLGAVSQGMVVVPLDPKLPESEVEDLLRRTGAKALLCTERQIRELSVGLLRRLTGQPGGIAVLDLARFGRPFPGLEPPARARGHGRIPGPQDLASILFTSGTTIAPKGVMLSHGNFVANVQAVAEFLEAAASDRFLSVLPLHHVFEFTCGLLTPLWIGARITYLATLGSPQIVAAMQERAITVLLGVPRLYQLLAQGIEAQIAAAGPIARRAARMLTRLADWTGMRARRALFRRVHRALGGRVRLLISGGAPLDAELYDRFHAMGFVLCEGYGLTETAPVLTVNPPDRTRRGSVGLPLPGVDLRIVGAHGDGVGEIVVRGPNVMRGYVGQPELTASSLRDGWLHTGDLGRLDADGYLYITGRLKDVIITPAGKTLSPEEVEESYKDLPGVLESCVVGMPSPTGSGEGVHLVVVPDGTAGVDQAEILRAIDARANAVPTHRRIQRVHFLAGELPKTTTLKVKRGAVRRLLEAEVQAQAGAASPRHEAGAPMGASPQEQAVLGLIARLAGIPASRVAPEAHLERDLGIDSLMRVEILAFLDAQRARPLPEDRITRATTVGDVLNLARRQRGWEGRGGVSWQRLLAQPATERRPLQRMPRPGVFDTMVRAARALLGGYCGISTDGLEHLPAKGPFLLAANHTSHLDALAVLAALGERAREVSLVGARDYFFNRTWKRLVLPQVLHIIPFDREGDFLEGLRLCREAIGQGRSLLIFPEGTRSQTGELLPFKAGVGVLAVELGLPIVPTAVLGTYQALPKGRAVPRRHPIRVVFGPPVLPASPDSGDEATAYERYREVVERVMGAVAALRASAPRILAVPGGPDR